MPSDPPTSTDDSVQVWSVESGNVLITSTTGIAFIEIFTEGDELCRNHLEYVNSENGPPKQLILTESEIRARLPEDKRNRKLKLGIFSYGGGKHDIDDFTALASKSSQIKLPNGRVGFRGGKLGYSQMEHTKHQELIFGSAVEQTKLMTGVRVFHGFAVDGIEFLYEDITSQMFGKKGGDGKGSLFELDTRRGEAVMGFYLRDGVWIDGIQILTSTGRRSEVYGNPTGGSGHTLMPPRGFRVAGIYGSCGQWVDGFGLIICR